jgi:hypothetical protein
MMKQIRSIVARGPSVAEVHINQTIARSELAHFVHNAYHTSPFRRSKRCSRRTLR